MAVRRTPEEAISHYGTVAGSWEVRRGTPSYERLTISTVVEKPTIDEARLNLTTPGLADGEYPSTNGTEACTFQSATIAGYVPGSNVTEHAKIDLDQEAMMAALKSGDWDEAKAKYAPMAA